MTRTNQLKHHANLVDRMANAVGVDLQEHMLRPDGPTIDDLTDAVLRRTQCSDPGHCAQWLSERSAGADRTPGYCRNQDFLQRMGVN